MGFGCPGCPLVCHAVSQVWLSVGLHRVAAWVPFVAWVALLEVDSQAAGWAPEWEEPVWLSVLMGWRLIEKDVTAAPTVLP